MPNHHTVIKDGLPPRMPESLWLHRSEITADALMDMFPKCHSRRPGSCAHTRFSIHKAAITGRTIRHFGTYTEPKNRVEWSELIDGEWHRFFQRLNSKALNQIADFDGGDKVMFAPGTASPYAGPVEWLGRCINLPRNPEQRAQEAKRLRALRAGERFVTPQRRSVLPDVRHSQP